MFKEIQSGTRYRILRKIASGGMGTIYEAVQLGTRDFRKHVAIKMLLPALSEDPRFIDLLVDEAKVVANLVHENIVQIYQLEQSAEDAYFIVMEYVHGVSLAKFINYHAATESRVPVDLAVFITSRVAHALSYAHTRSDAEGHPLDIVHQDVSPGNILITSEGLPKLTDFGIARAVNRVLNRTDFGVMGKPAYLAPEQARGMPALPQSDIYSLGLVLYELLMMKPPRKESGLSLLQAAREGWLEWSALKKEIPERLYTCMRHMLALESGDRYESAAELARDLDALIYPSSDGPGNLLLETYMKRNFAYLYVPSWMSLYSGDGRTGPAPTIRIEEHDEEVES